MPLRKAEPGMLFPSFELGEYAEPLNQHWNWVINGYSYSIVAGRVCSKVSAKAMYPSAQAILTYVQTFFIDDSANSDLINL